MVWKKERKKRWIEAAVWFGLVWFDSLAGRVGRGYKLRFVEEKWEKSRGLGRNEGRRPWFIYKMHLASGLFCWLVGFADLFLLLQNMAHIVGIIALHPRLTSTLSQQQNTALSTIQCSSLYVFVQYILKQKQKRTTPTVNPNSRTKNKYFERRVLGTE